MNLFLAFNISEFLVWSQYWYAIVSAGIGAGLGIWWANCRFAKQTKSADAAAKLALSVVLNRITELAVQAHGQFQGGQPNFPLETERAAHICNKISNFRNADLRAAIEGLLYQCSHYNGKLVVVNSAFMTVLVQQGNPAILGPYSQMMIKHLDQIIADSKAVRARVDAEAVSH